MSELSNALQGKLNDRKSHLRELDTERQLDLFSSLADREVKAPRIVMSKPEAPEAPRSEPELVLPGGPSASPPDVAADVRAALSESGGGARMDEAAGPEGEHPLPRTGIYHRPARHVAPPPEAAPSRGREAPDSARVPLAARVRAWVSGLEVDRRTIALVVVLVVGVAGIAYWTARPGEGGGEEAVADGGAGEPPMAVEEVSPVAPVAPAPSPVVAQAPAVSPSPARVPMADWKIPGVETTMNGGAWQVRFADPVFVSADKISVEGMRALKALASKLVEAKISGRVVVTGHTDDVPLSKPTDRFRSNADIAEARGKVAMEHLAQFSRANPGLVFEARAGGDGTAPYPNDTPQNRRLNRTATVLVVPSGN